MGLLVVFVLGLGYKFYHQGFHNIGFVASVAIAAGLLFIFLAPERFRRSQRPSSRDSEADDIRWK